MAVTFTLSGATLKDGATGSYKAAISYADGDWSPSYWGGASGDTTVSGNGTYTVWFAPGALCEGIMVFTIDIAGMTKDIVDLSTVSVTIDKILIK